MKSIIIALLVIALGVGAWFYFYGSAPASVNQTGGGAAENVGSTMPVPAEDGVTEMEVNGSAPTSAEVTLAADGFSPRSVTLKKGGTVTFVNESSGEMWVASAQHPTHSVYAGTTLQQHCDTLSNDSFDQCAVGGTYSFTFEKVGSWNYHNHVGSGQFGTVVVVE